MHKIAKKLDLSNDSSVYIRARLSEGKSLSLLLNTVKLEDGRFFTYLPDDVPSNLVTSFNYGGVTSRDSSEPVIIDLIKTYLSGSSNTIALFEDAVALPSDPYLKTSSDQYFLFDSEVYHFLTCYNTHPEAILRAIRVATSHVFTCALATFPISQRIYPGSEVSFDLLQRIVDNTDYLLVGAYDNEGVLVWAR